MNECVSVKEKPPEDKKRVLLTNPDWRLYNPMIGRRYYITGVGLRWDYENGL